jgi:hypothetical protein
MSSQKPIFTVTSSAQPWPEWLTPEYAAIHTAIYNEIVKALGHCIDSAEADGRDYTTEGWISISAGNVVVMLQRAGSPPPVVEPAERLPLPAGTAWDPADDGLTACPTCDGEGFVDAPEDAP